MQTLADAARDAVPIVVGYVTLGLAAGMLLVAEGRTNREVAGELFLAEKTVKNYVSTVLSKLGLERRAQVAA